MSKASEKFIDVAGYGEGDGSSRPVIRDMEPDELVALVIVTGELTPSRYRIHEVLVVGCRNAEYSKVTSNTDKLSAVGVTI
jgi:hypothetical protein